MSDNKLSAHQQQEASSCENIDNDNNNNDMSALEQARRLQAPLVTATTGGEMEHLEFWQTHESLLRDAWKEWWTQQESESPVKLLLGEDNNDMVNPQLAQHVQALWDNPSVEKEQALQHAMFWNSSTSSSKTTTRPEKEKEEKTTATTVVDENNNNNDDNDDEEDVYFVCEKFLTTQGIQRLRHHLTAISQGGIPTRRPNGMNRYGVVLGDAETPGGVSYPEMDDFIGQYLVNQYLRPISRMLFPQYAGNPEDDISSYAFTIHYQAPNKTSTQARRHHVGGGDIKLDEHSDASLYTININLNLPHDDNDENDNENDNQDLHDGNHDNDHSQDDEDGLFEGSDVVFWHEKKVKGNNKNKNSNNTVGGETTTTTRRRSIVKMKPGMAVFHRGMHRHMALPIQQGERHQLVIWLFGKDGYVRIAPYEPKEQMSVRQRWSQENSAAGTKKQSSSSNIFDYYY